MHENVKEGSERTLLSVSTHVLLQGRRLREVLAAHLASEWSMTGMTLHTPSVHHQRTEIGDQSHLQVALDLLFAREPLLAMSRAVRPEAVIVRAACANMRRIDVHGELRYRSKRLRTPLPAARARGFAVRTGSGEFLAGACGRGREVQYRGGLRR